MGFKMKDQRSKAAKPQDSSYLYEIFRLKREWVPVSSHLRFLPNAGIKDMQHHYLASVAS